MMSARSQYCNGCLNEKYAQLHEYKVTNSVLKSVCKDNTIFLCYICKKIAQRTEKFVENVQSNQILLENIAQETDPHKKVSQNKVAIISLAQYSQILVDISKENIENENLSSVVENSIPVLDDAETEDEKKDIEIAIKEELKEELFHFEQLEEDYIEDGVKCEDVDEFYVKQESINLEELDLKQLSLVLKRAVKKKPIKKGEKRIKGSKLLKTKIHSEKKSVKTKCDANEMIERIYVTKAECLKEMKRKANEDLYKNAVYKCTDCIKGFTYKKSYETHLLKHSESQGDYECDICKQRTDSDVKLKWHKERHEMRYKCLVCGITRSDRRPVKEHYILAHTDNFIEFSCDLCPKKFRRKKTMKQHILTRHSGKERVECGHCKKTYANKQVLKSHIVSCHSGEELSRRFVCDDCGKGFTCLSLLRNHAVTHTDTKEHYCVECDKSFKTKLSLQQHLKLTQPHAKMVDLPYPCQHCDKRFAVKRALEHHTNRIHLNVKPFQCDKCDRAYVNGWSLTEHKRLAHEGYKRPLKYPCNLCDKVFDRNQILQSHVRTHTGERPFHCAACGAQFAQRSVLYTHTRLVHLRLARDGRPKIRHN